MAIQSKQHQHTLPIPPNGTVTHKSISPKLLSSFSLVMITVGAVSSPRSLPTIALFGSSLVFFFTVSALCFLVPSSLVTAELAAAWPEDGGMYVWVKHAFGKPMGFLAIWLQWVGNIFWYPTVLSFAAATLGYLISPELASNKWFVAMIISGSFWGMTVINLYGMHSSVTFGNICTIFGLLFPMVLIVCLGIKWYVVGNPIQISFNPHDFFTNVGNSELWIALTGIIVSLTGMEIATIHAPEVKDPHRAFPISLSIATAIIFFTLLFGSLAVAEVLPEQQINLVVGVMQTFSAFFGSYKAPWLMPLIALILILGCLGGINNWIIAPTKGLSIAAKDGHLPLYFARENKHRAPHILLVYQAVIVTLVIMVFLLMPNVNAAYWLLTVMAAQLYMIMYSLLFAAGIVLRFRHPQRHRPFRIPFTNVGMCVTAIVGIICSLLTFAVGFIPPSIIEVGDTSRYVLMILLGLVLMCAPPLLIYHCYAKHRI